MYVYFRPWCLQASVKKISPVYPKDVVTGCGNLSFLPNLLPCPPLPYLIDPPFQKSLAEVINSMEGQDHHNLLLPHVFWP